ncbi:MAG: arylamine N-acetyltransferase [Caulobacter sp.]|nr:arylamine N-acetyltransferase [Caulobacter sp.]
MDLAAYFRRIGFQGEARPDLATLKAVHRAHLLAIPYENLDVQLGRPVTTEPAAAFEKIVERRRGGWCYEMNGLLGWALAEIGFSVTRMAGGVGRVLLGDAAEANHLILRVDLDDGPWLADVGFGDGPLDPFPIKAGPFRSGLFDFALEAQSDGWWRVHNHPRGGAPSFDFRDRPGDEAALSARCHWLQTAQDSVFVQNAVVQRHGPEGLSILRGRTLLTLGVEDTTKQTIPSADAYIEVLDRVFGLDLPEAADLWPAIRARHEALFGPTA